MNPDEQTAPIDPIDPIETIESTEGISPENPGAPKNGLLSIILSILTGSVAGIFLHYILYLMSIPQKPFIYAWF